MLLPLTRLTYVTCLRSGQRERRTTTASIMRKHFFQHTKASVKCHVKVIILACTALMLEILGDPEFIIGYATIPTEMGDLSFDGA